LAQAPDGASSAPRHAPPADAVAMAATTAVAPDDGTSALFFPQRDHEPVPARDMFAVPCRDGSTLLCCRLLRARRGTVARRTLVYFHGNGELVSKLYAPSGIPGIPNFRDLLDYLLASEHCGLASAVLVEYRGHGPNAALGPTLASLLSDAEDVVRALGVAEEQLVVMGRSTGTIPAVHLAGLHPKLFALVVESGMGDALAWVAQKLGTPTADFERTPVGHMLRQRQATLRDFPGVFLVLHCADEEVFPLEEHGRRNFLLACGSEHVAEPDAPVVDLSVDPMAPCVLRACDTSQGMRAVKALCEFENGGHNFIWPMNWKAYSACLKRLLVGTLLADASGSPVPGSWWTDVAKSRFGSDGRRLESRRGCVIT